MVRKTKLRRKLTEQPATLVVGVVAAPGSDPRPVPFEVTAADVLRMVDEFAGRRVYIDEQDYDFYIIRLDVDPTAETGFDGAKWVLVTPDSPFYAPLKQIYRPSILGRVRYLWRGMTGSWRSVDHY